MFQNLPLVRFLEVSHQFLMGFLHFSLGSILLCFCWLRMGNKDIAAIGSDNEKALKTLQAPEIHRNPLREGCSQGC
jgi:hypothetical protein